MLTEKRRVQLAMALLPLAFLAHAAEEWLCGAGFPAWALAVFGREVSALRLGVVNLLGCLVTAVVVVAYLRKPQLRWLAPLLATAFALNGVLHAFATAWFSAYSPGTVTGLLLFVPLGSVVLIGAWQTMPRVQFIAAVLAGVVMHATVIAAAFA